MPRDLGARLLDAGILDRERLASALLASPYQGGPLARELVQQGLEEQLLAEFFVGEGFGPLLQLSDLMSADPAVVRRIPAAMATTLGVVPVKSSPLGLTVAMMDPSDQHAIREIAFAVGEQVLPAVARVTDVLQVIQRFYPRSSLPSAPQARTGRPSGRLLTPSSPPRPSESSGIRMKSSRVPPVQVRTAVSSWPADSHTPPLPSWAPLPEATEYRQSGRQPPDRVATHPDRPIASARGASSRDDSNRYYATVPEKDGISSSPTNAPSSRGDDSWKVPSRADSPIRQQRPTGLRAQIPTPYPHTLRSPAPPMPPRDSAADSIGFFPREETVSYRPLPQTEPPPPSRPIVDRNATVTASETPLQWEDFDYTAPLHPVRAPTSQSPAKGQSTPPDSSAEFGYLLARIRGSEDRDEIVRLACKGAVSVARCAVLFARRANTLQGWAVAGAGQSQDAIRNLYLPTRTPSVFHNVLARSKSYVGTLQSGTTDLVYRVAVGMRGGDVHIFPVVVRKRVVALLCVDGVVQEPIGRDRIEIIARTVSQAFSRIVAEKRSE